MADESSGGDGGPEGWDVPDRRAGEAPPPSTFDTPTYGARGPFSRGGDGGGNRGPGRPGSSGGSAPRRATMAYKKPPSYLFLAVLTAVVCCLPAAIPALIYANQVDRKWAYGDYGGAVLSSRRARLWCIIGLVGSLVVLVISLIVIASAPKRGGNYRY